MAHNLTYIAQRAACVYRNTQTKHTRGFSAKQVQHLSSFVFSLYRLAYSSCDATSQIIRPSRCASYSFSSLSLTGSRNAVLRHAARHCAEQLHERLLSIPRGHVFPIDVLLSLTRILQYGFYSSGNNDGSSSDDGGDIFRLDATLDGTRAHRQVVSTRCVRFDEEQSAMLTIDSALLATILTILNTRLDVSTLMQWSPSWLLQLLHGVAHSFPCDELHPFTYTAEASADARAMGSTAHRPPLLVYDIGLCLQSSPARRPTGSHALWESALGNVMARGDSCRSSGSSCSHGSSIAHHCASSTGSAVDQLNATQCALLLWSIVTLRLDSALPLLWTMTCRRCRELFLTMTSSSQALVTRALITLPDCVDESHAQLLSVMCSHARSLQSPALYDGAENGDEDGHASVHASQDGYCNATRSEAGYGDDSREGRGGEFGLLSELWMSHSDLATPGMGGLRDCNRASVSPGSRAAGDNSADLSMASAARHSAESDAAAAAAAADAPVPNSSSSKSSCRPCANTSVGKSHFSSWVNPNARYGANDGLVQQRAGRPAELHAALRYHNATLELLSLTRALPAESLIRLVASLWHELHTLYLHTADTWTGSSPSVYTPPSLPHRKHHPTPTTHTTSPTRSTTPSMDVSPRTAPSTDSHTHASHPQPPQPSSPLSESTAPSAPSPAVTSATTVLLRQIYTVSKHLMHKSTGEMESILFLESVQPSWVFLRCTAAPHCGAGGDASWTLVTQLHTRLAHNAVGTLMHANPRALRAPHRAMLALLTAWATDAVAPRSDNTSRMAFREGHSVSECRADATGTTTAATRATHTTTDKDSNVRNSDTLATTLDEREPFWSAVLRVMDEAEGRLGRSEHGACKNGAGVGGEYGTTLWAMAVVADVWCCAHASSSLPVRSSSSRPHSSDRTRHTHTGMHGHLHAMPEPEQESHVQTDVPTKRCSTNDTIWASMKSIAQRVRDWTWRHRAQSSDSAAVLLCDASPSHHNFSSSKNSSHDDDDDDERSRVRCCVRIVASASITGSRVLHLCHTRAPNSLSMQLLSSAVQRLCAVPRDSMAHFSIPTALHLLCAVDASAAEARLVTSALMPWVMRGLEGTALWNTICHEESSSSSSSSSSDISRSRILGRCGTCTASGNAIVPSATPNEHDDASAVTRPASPMSGRDAITRTTPERARDALGNQTTLKFTDRSVSAIAAVASVDSPTQHTATALSDALCSSPSPLSSSDCVGRGAMESAGEHSVRDAHVRRLLRELAAFLLHRHYRGNYARSGTMGPLLQAHRSVPAAAAVTHASPEPLFRTEVPAEGVNGRTELCKATAQIEQAPQPEPALPISEKQDHSPQPHSPLSWDVYQADRSSRATDGSLVGAVNLSFVPDVLLELYVRLLVHTHGEQYGHCPVQHNHGGSHSPAGRDESQKDTGPCGGHDAAQEQTWPSSSSSSSQAMTLSHSSMLLQALLVCVQQRCRSLPALEAAFTLLLTRRQGQHADLLTSIRLPLETLAALLQCAIPLYTARRATAVAVISRLLQHALLALRECCSWDALTDMAALLSLNAMSELNLKSAMVSAVCTRARVLLLQQQHQYKEVVTPTETEDHTRFAVIEPIQKAYLVAYLIRANVDVDEELELALRGECVTPSAALDRVQHVSCSVDGHA